jgi:hypothetical protein
MLNVFMLCVIMLSIILPNVVMLSVVMLNVIMQSVMVPISYLGQFLLLYNIQLSAICALSLLMILIKQYVDKICNLA